MSQAEPVAIVVTSKAGPGILHQLTGVIARHDGDITSVEILDRRDDRSRVYLEIKVRAAGAMLEELGAMPIVQDIERVETFQRVYGKRIIIIGGGAQVGQVAIGAISEADRHNIRGEKISVDTIPLVGEGALAEAVRAVARLPRARVLVLAGSLMGGQIVEAVTEVRGRGLIVVSLNMAGGVPEAADLVVTDPVQAGVMAVMAVADTARFSIARLTKRTF
jgi:energy-converting hydrogenase B subunit Q